VGERNIEVDLVKPFANIVDGEFLEVVHRLPQNPDGPVVADCPDYPISFPLKSSLNGYRYTSLMFPWNR